MPAMLKRNAESVNDFCLDSSCDCLTEPAGSIYYIVKRHKLRSQESRYAIVSISSHGHRFDGGRFSDDSGGHKSRDGDGSNRPSGIWRSQSSIDVVGQIADDICAGVLVSLGSWRHRIRGVVRAQMEWSAPSIECRDLASAAPVAWRPICRRQRNCWIHLGGIMITSKEHMARPPATEPETAVRLILNMRSVGLTDDQFFRLCRDNRDLRIEMTAQGELIVMSPTNPETGRKNDTATALL
jgi:hypothetical protein